MVGSNRIIPGKKIVNPMGDADLDPQDEKELRRTLAKEALKALQADIKEQTIFD
jgi:glycine/betaine/sarcosine/D-proline reductase family selenoprotein B